MTFGTTLVHIANNNLLLNFITAIAKPFIEQRDQHDTLIHARMITISLIKFSFILIYVGVPSLTIVCKHESVLVFFRQSFPSSIPSIIFDFLKVMIMVQSTL